MLHAWWHITETQELLYMHVFFILPLFDLFFVCRHQSSSFRQTINARFCLNCLCLSTQQHAINLNQHVQDKGL